MDSFQPDANLSLAYEFELVPIARAMIGQDVKEAKKIRPQWAMRPESVKAYATLQNTPDDMMMVTFTTFMHTDQYMANAVRNIGDATSTKDIGEWMRKGWVKRTEEYWVKRLLDATDFKGKMACAAAIRGLYHESTPEAYVIDLSNPSPPEEFLMTYEGVNYRPKGDISVIKAKKKSGKSSFLKIEIACMICPSGQVLGMSRSFIPGTETIRDPYNVLWIDTEQSHASSDKCYREVMKLAGLPLDRNDSHLKMINFRTMDSQNRLNQLEEETILAPWDVVILDGVKDVVKNINDPIETDNVMARILQLIQDTKVSFITVLHENPAKDTDKMRGWLGTELGNKAFEEQEVRLNKKTGVFTVINTDRREKTVPAYGFRFNDEDQLEQADPELDGDGQEQGQYRSREEVQAQNQAKYCNQVKKAFEDNPSLAYKHADLIRLLIKKSKLTDSTARNRIKVAYDVGVIKVIEGEVNKRGAVYALVPKEQTFLNILKAQNTTINEDGTIPDIFEQENGQIDDCPY